MCLIKLNELLNIWIYMYLKYNIFNATIFYMKIGLNEWFNNFINTWLVSLLDESVFLNESLEWMTQWQIHCLTGTCCHLVGERCNRHKRYLKHQLLSKDDYHRHQCLYLNYKPSSQYFCHNMNDCMTGIILCSWREAAKHGNRLLSVSDADLNVLVWLFQRFNRHRSVVFI